MNAQNWSYFNGTQHGYNDSVRGYIPPVPLTLAYCASCGPDKIQGFDKSLDKDGRGHWKNRL